MRMPLRTGVWARPWPPFFWSPSGSRPTPGSRLRATPEDLAQVIDGLLEIVGAYPADFLGQIAVDSVYITYIL